MIKCICAVLSLFCCFSGFSANKTAGNERHVPVIMYHSVCKTNVGSYVISPESLRKDFEYLSRRGYKSVFISEIADFCEGKGKLPEKAVALTFDDGFYNNAYYAAKIAEKYGMKITISIVGSYSEKEDGEKKRSPVYSYLNRTEIKKLHDSGMVELCNHTYDMHHPSSPRRGMQRRKGESAESYRKAVESDSEKCRKFVKSCCGKNTDVFTYPFGYCSGSTAEILSKLGYRAILTCKEGINVFKKGDTSALMKIMRYNRSGNISTEKFFAKLKI